MLQAYSTPLKLKNFRYTAGEVTTQWSGLKILKNVSNLMTVLTELSQPSAYLTAAEATLPPQHQWFSEMNTIRDTLFCALNDVRQRNSNGFSYHAQQQLNGVQQNYITAYIQLHKKARLGAIETQSKKDLLNDKRLLNLKKLSRITLLPRQQLTDFEHRLNHLQSCYALNENDLIAHTLCPHCGYHPLSDVQTTTVVQLEKKLEQLDQRWTQSLLTELENTEIPRDLLKAETCTQLDKFLESRSLPENITREFIEAVQEGLSGLVKVSVTFKELENALQAGGSAMTVQELQKRFINYLNGLTKGKELNRVRLVVE